MKPSAMRLQPEPPVGKCRNCGAPIDGAYCSNCGQETKIELPSASAFLRDAAGRYVAFDGRMWRTLAALLFRPGFLTREYLAGRRRRYIRPARLFLVLTLILFAVVRIVGVAPVIIDPASETAKDEALAGEDKSDDFIIRLDPDMNVKVKVFETPWLGPLKQRLDAFNRLTPQEKSDQIFAGALRYGPYAMTALLPVFAALLQVAYLGRSGRYPHRPRRYAAHLLFGAHNHAFLFLIASVFVVLPYGFLQFALFIWACFYGLWSLKSVYGGRWLGVIVRAILISVAYFVCFLVAMSGLLMAAIALR
jgi:Protein of unknown function (DUF3667)